MIVRTPGSSCLRCFVCGLTQPFEGHTAKAMRKAAALVGWAREGNEDYCPSHKGVTTDGGIKFTATLPAAGRGE